MKVELYRNQDLIKRALEIIEDKNINILEAMKIAEEELEEMDKNE